MTELTPEAQAVLDAAAEPYAVAALVAAADKYAASLRPPDPITGYAYKTDAPLTVYPINGLGGGHRNDRWEVRVEFVKKVTP